MTEAALGPSSSGSVVLELGPEVGALILHTPPELDRAEIEISARRRRAWPRTHSQVRQRYTANGVQYAAVYPNLPAGEYIIWRDATTCAAVVTVVGGQVTTQRWPD